MMICTDAMWGTWAKGLWSSSGGTDQRAFSTTVLDRLDIDHVDFLLCIRKFDVSSLPEEYSEDCTTPRAQHTKAASYMDVHL